MSEEVKKEGGATEEKTILISTESALQEEFDKETFVESTQQQNTSATVKNLVSGIILLIGIVVGSMFIDVAQLFSRSGYSERALQVAQIFQGGGKTWVAYEEVPVSVTTLTVDDGSLKDCPKCDPTEVLMWMRRFMPTISPQKVDVASPEGKRLVEEFNIKTVPSFIFDNSVKDLSFFKGEGKVLFVEEKDRLLFNTVQLGVPVGKYLETPNIADSDPVLGNRDAKVKIVIYSDFQCPYCKTFWGTITAIAKGYGDQVALTYKEMPLEFHPQADNAAFAAMCANEQEKFWEMGDLLYTNQQEWGKATGKEIFKTYGKKLGLNVKQFNECLDIEKYNDKIKGDAQEAMDFGISGTPSGFINGQFLGGVLKDEDIKKIIDEELQNGQL